MSAAGDASAPIPAALMALVLSSLASSTTAAAAAADGAACFEDLEQHYAWDDGGLQWSLHPDRCPGSSQPASPADRKWGGSVDIRVSGNDASVVEESYAWVISRAFKGPGCPPLTRSVTRTTRVAKSGVLYQTKVVEGVAEPTTQRPLRPGQVIYTNNIQTVPNADDPYIQRAGSDTIAGQPCQRITSKPVLPGTGTFAMCIFVAPRNCPAAQYLQPLELTSKGPDGKVTWHGLTSQLRYGGRGQVVSADSIKVP